MLEEDDISPLNLGMISAFYYVNYITIEAFNLSLKSNTKRRGLLEIICAAAEFEDIPIRHHEEEALRRIYDRVPVKVDDRNFNDPHFKANILLQAHFSRIQLTPDLESDQNSILLKVTRLIQACVDVISSNGWLNPAIKAMELSQMSVQALWAHDSPLRQIPHLTQDTIAELAKRNVEQVFDLMEMEDQERTQVLGLDKARLAQVANFVNRYPNIEVQLELEEERVKEGDTCTLKISLEREHEDDEDDIGPVIAPLYPAPKDEGWWLVIGDNKTNDLLAIKRVNLVMQHTLSLQFSAPEKAGNYDLVLYFMCDSYMGVDQDFEFKLHVDPNEDVDMTE